MSTSPSAVASALPKAFNWSIVLSVLLILAGILAICVPSISGVAITLVFGWLMVISAITHFVFAFKTHTTGGVIWELLLGVVYLVAGVFLIMHPLAGLVTLTLFIACYLFFEGIFEIIQYFQIHPRHGAGWLLFDAVITIVLGFMIWRSWPVSSVWVVGTLVGISMLFSGISRLMLSLAAKRALHHLTP